MSDEPRQRESRAEITDRIKRGVPPEQPVVVIEGDGSRLEQLRKRRKYWDNVQGPGWLLKQRAQILPALEAEIAALEQEQGQ